MDDSHDAGTAQPADASVTTSENAVSKSTSSRQAGDWDALLRDIGADPTPDAGQRRRPAIQNELAPVTIASSIPKPQGGDWNALARELGVAGPEGAAPAAIDAPSLPETSPGKRPRSASAKSSATTSRSAKSIPREESSPALPAREDSSSDASSSATTKSGSQRQDASLARAPHDDEGNSEENANSAAAQLGADDSIDSSAEGLSGDAARTAFEALFSAGSFAALGKPSSPPTSRRSESRPLDNEQQRRANQQESESEDLRNPIVFDDPGVSDDPIDPIVFEEDDDWVQGGGASEDANSATEERVSGSKGSGEEEEADGRGKSRRRRPRRRGRGRDRDRQFADDDPARRAEVRNRTPADDFTPIDTELDDADLDARFDDALSTDEQGREGDAPEETDGPGTPTRRRRRRPRRRRAEGEAPTSEEATSEEATQDEDPWAGDGASDDDDDGSLYSGGGRGADRQNDDDDDDDTGELAPASHRNIPTWSDALSVMIESNIQNRKDSPSRGAAQSQRGRGRGRGGRGRKRS